MAKDKGKDKGGKPKAVVNTTPHVVNVAYKVTTPAGVQLESLTLAPGLNRVPLDIFRLIAKESGFKKLVDQDVLSGSPGNISLAKDVEREQKKGKDSKEIVPPNKTGNAANRGAPLSNTMSDATKGK